MSAAYCVKYRTPDGWRARGCFKRGRQGWTKWTEWANFRFMFEAVAALSEGMPPKSQRAVWHRGKIVWGPIECGGSQ